MAEITPHQLRDAIEQSFSLGELKSMSFELSIEYDNLPGETRSLKVLSLVQYAMRHGRINDLVAYVQSARPHLNLAEIDTNTPSSTPAASSTGPTITYNFNGPMTGVAFDGGTVTAENIAGGDININTSQPENKSEFIAQLEAVKSLLEKALADGEIVDRRDGETAVEDIDDAIEEAKSDAPRKGRLIRRLEDAEEIVEKSGSLIDKARSAASAILKAAPIVAGLKKAAELLF